MKTNRDLIAAGLFLWATAAFSQQAVQPSKPSPLAQREFKAIKALVSNLTPDQQTKILAIEETYAQGVEDERNTKEPSRDVMMSKLRDLREQRNYKMRSVLSAAQYAQYQSMPEHVNDDLDSGTPK
ncbi:MAG: hypothetical protein HKL88_03170 [Bacteroidia bacterium]|nr:hypothetical protein [Bacteroidia bacterium]